MSAVFALLIVVLSAGMAAGGYFYNLAIDRASSKASIRSAPHNIDREIRTEAQKAERQKRYEDWRSRVRCEDIQVRSADGLRLRGTLVHQEREGRRWVILCHGYGDCSDSYMMFLAQNFHDLGYQPLLVDARGHGVSEGKYVGMGWHDRLDLLVWIGEILRRDRDAAIVLFGISMGGATVLMASGEDLPANVKAIVEDSGYTSAWEECAYQLRALYRLPPFPVLHFASLVIRLRAGYWLRDADARKQIAKSQTPTLFIHGDADTFVPAAMLDKLYAAARCPKQKLLVEGAGHGQAPTVAKERYWHTIADFLGEHVEEHRPAER